MRNACMITLCLGLAGCRAFPANPPPIESRPPIHRPAEIHPSAPVAVQEHKDPQVIYLQLVNNDLRATPRDISTLAASTYSPPIVVPTAPVPDAAAMVQAELAILLSARISELKAKVQDLNAQVMARRIPPKDPLPSEVASSLREVKQHLARIDEQLTALRTSQRATLAEPAPLQVRSAVTLVAGTTRIPPVPMVQLPGESPPASQTRINRLIGECLAELEREIRDPGARE